MTTLDWYTKNLRKLSMGQEVVVSIELLAHVGNGRNSYSTKFVQIFLKEIDPAGYECRRQHSIKGRQYINPGWILLGTWH